MSELHIFSENDELLHTFTPDTGLKSAPFREEINRVADTPLKFTVEADVEGAEYVVAENQVIILDREGDWRLFIIKELDEQDSKDGPITTATCEPAFMENIDRLIVDRRVYETTAQDALNVALEPTRWVGEVEVDLGINSTNFYYISAIDAVWKVRNTWGGDLKDVIEFTGKRLTRRVIKLKQRRGADRGKSFEIDKDITQINRTVLSYPVTALYGRGKSLPTEDGGYTRFIDFADVEWSIANGDPVDKPLGQKWVGDPEALEKYGILINGVKQHREQPWKNENYEDPLALLQATWEQLQKVKEPEVNYQLKVKLLAHLLGYEHEEVYLGDTVRAIDRNFSIPIALQVRVIAFEYDLVNPNDTAVVELGQFLSIDEPDDRIDKIEETISDNRGNWDSGGIVTDENFPDTTPPVPTNFRANGLFKLIQLMWDYNAASYIAAYELYASKVANFIPQPEHLVWRGKTGGYNLEVNINEQWYFRLRAINTHGTPSDFTDEIQATSVRINGTTDIAPLTITNELIAEDAEIDFAKIGNVEITDAMITGQLSAGKIKIGSGTTFDSGYDPTKIEVGGQNIARGLGGNAYDLDRIYVSDRGFASLVDGQGGQWIAYTGSNQLRIGSITIKPNTTYTWSFNVYTTGTDTEITITQWGENGSYGHKSYGIGTSPTRITHTFTTEPDITYEILHITTLIETDQYYFSDFQLQEGDKATAYTLPLEDVKQQITDLDSSVNEQMNNITTEYQAYIQSELDGINLSVDTKITDSENNLITYIDTEVQAARDSFEISFSELQVDLDDHTSTLNEIKTYFTFTPEHLEIGKTESPLGITISNEQIDFLDNGVSVAYINGQKMYITSTEVTESLVVGVHRIEKENNDITLVQWVGE